MATYKKEISVKIELKIKMDDGKEITLDEKEAKELYNKLGEVFSKEKEYIYTDWNRWYWDIYKWRDKQIDTTPYITWCSTGHNIEMCVGGAV